MEHIGIDVHKNQSIKGQSRRNALSDLVSPREPRRERGYVDAGRTFV
jgi:hypothetical protein